MRARWVALGLLALLVFTACGDEDEPTAIDSIQHGQITRPGDIGLPLNNPASLAAFEVAERFLTSWFLLDDPEASLEKVHPDVREFWGGLVEETQVTRTCSFVQVEGSQLDASGVVLARYAIAGCQVVAPGEFTAVFIRLSMTAMDDGIWVTQIEFLR